MRRLGLLALVVVVLAGCALLQPRDDGEGHGPLGLRQGQAGAQAPVALPTSEAPAPTATGEPAGQAVQAPSAAPPAAGDVVPEPPAAPPQSSEPVAVVTPPATEVQPNEPPATACPPFPTALLDVP